MQTSTLSELKKELVALSPEKVLEICLRLVKYKKENKELLSYILFDALDEDAFIIKLKEEMNLQFDAMNTSNLYLVKKSLRKILRGLNKYIRYSGKAETEVELRIYFCNKVISSEFDLNKSTALNNLYQNQRKKIHKVLQSMHDDLQYDFLKQLQN